MGHWQDGTHWKHTEHNLFEELLAKLVSIRFELRQIRAHPNDSRDHAIMMRIVEQEFPLLKDPRVTPFIMDAYDDKATARQMRMQLDYLTRALEKDAAQYVRLVQENHGHESAQLKDIRVAIARDEEVQKHLNVVLALAPKGLLPQQDGLAA